MPRENYAATVSAWRLILDSVDEDVVQDPQVRRLVAKLEIMYERAQQLVHERAALQAAKQEKTRELQEILPNGRVTINCLRKILRYQFGKENPRLIQYGIRPYRRRARSKKEEAPEDGASP